MSTVNNLSVTTSSFKQESISFLKTLAIFILAAFILRGTVVEAFKIPSLSMFPTLRVGDHILVSKLSYGFRLPLISRTVYQYGIPKRADVVVFTRPDEPDTEEDESATNIIKRIIGLPGDIVEVRGTSVYINNQLIMEPYAQWQEGGIPEGNFGPERVPEGKVFLMGDNRDHSKDSRFWGDGFHYLDIGLIKGRALIIYFSWDSLSRVGNVIR